MADLAKKNFILSLKKLQYFFNHIKQFEPNKDDQANSQEVTNEQMNETITPLSQLMEEATKAIQESQRFCQLIETQDNVKMKKSLQEKQALVEEQEKNQEILRQDLKHIQYKIEEQKVIEQKIKEQIEKGNHCNNLELQKLQLQIDQVNNQKDKFEKLSDDQINELQKQIDIVQFQNLIISQQLHKVEENNKFMWFYKQKGQNQKERINSKQKELQLYQQIIEESLNFLEDKINENREKQILVKEMNSQVQSVIEESLKQEQEFYESDTQDKLKTPPYVYVKRLERNQ